MTDEPRDEQTPGQENGEETEAPTPATWAGNHISYVEVLVTWKHPIPGAGAVIVMELRLVDPILRNGDLSFTLITDLAFA